MPEFDKKLYWKRRKKGLHGQVPAPGSKEHRYDIRVALRNEQAKLRKGIHERKKSKAIS